MARLSGEPGFLGGALHALVEPVRDDAFDFVEVNHWTGIAAFRAAISTADPDGILVQ